MGRRDRDALPPLLIAGVVAGVGGASITVGYLGSFTEGVTAGRGFIAIAVVIIGGWSPLGACAGALLFEFFDSLSLLAQTIGLNLPSALPYLVRFWCCWRPRVRATRHGRWESRRWVGLIIDVPV